MSYQLAPIESIIERIMPLLYNQYRDRSFRYKECAPYANLPSKTHKEEMEDSTQVLNALFEAFGVMERVRELDMSKCMCGGLSYEVTLFSGKTFKKENDVHK